MSTHAVAAKIASMREDVQTRRNIHAGLTGAGREWLQRTSVVNGHLIELGHVDGRDYAEIDMTGVRTTDAVIAELASEAFDGNHVRSAGDVIAAINSFIDADARDMDETGWNAEDVQVIRDQLTVSAATA